MLTRYKALHIRQTVRRTASAITARYIENNNPQRLSTRISFPRVSRALALVYCVGFTVAAGAPTALRHLERAAADPQRVPPVFVTMLYDRGERMFLFDRLENGETFVRAPHGRSSKRKGAQRIDPLRIVDDPDRGLDKVSVEELKSLVGVALVPRN